MKYEILPNGSLRISATEGEMADLRERAKDVNDSCQLEGECLERLIANSELDWIPEGTTGDLTSAPMLGITSIGDRDAGYRMEELPADRFGEVLAGGDEGGSYYTAIIARWAYMSYQVRSFVDDLIETGECVWQGGYAESEVNPDGPPASCEPRGGLRFEDLDTFTRHYIIAALWSSADSHDTMRVMAKEAGYSVKPDGTYFMFVAPDKCLSLESFEFESEAWEAAYREEFGSGELDDALDKRYGPEDIAQETLVQIKEDCEKFQKENRELLEAAYADGSLPVNGGGEREGEAASAGHDFWLTRNGHGAGFWDGDWDSVEDNGPEYGDRLTEAAEQFKEVCLYVGDDGRIHS